MNQILKYFLSGRSVGLENELIKKAGFDIKHIRTGRLERSLTLKNITSLINSYKGIKDAKDILREFKPDVLIGTGGYICIPTMLACQKLKIPYILHESNVFPGMSVKLMARKAAKIFVGFEDAKKYIKSKNVVFTGTPAKFNENDILRLNKNECKKGLGIDTDKKIILVACGSQGARDVSKTVLNMILKYQDESFFVVLISGNYYYEDIINLKNEIQNKLKKSIDKFVKIEKFVYEMDKMYKAADVAITRSGAMTVSELSIARVPSILIPFPNASENHQLYNAKVVENAGAGIVIEEKNLNVDILYDTLIKMIDKKTCAKMQNSSLNVDMFKVEEDIYLNVVDVVKKK